jgi:hypothetical protein
VGGVLSAALPPRAGASGIDDEWGAGEIFRLLWRRFKLCAAGELVRRQIPLIQKIPSDIREDRSTLVCQEEAKMPQVTVYKPNGETLLSTNAKKFEQTKGGLILHLEGDHAKAYGSMMITTLPYVILCGQGC